jgi:hypothetical protein
MTSRPRLARHGPESRMAERRSIVDPVSCGFLGATVSNTRRMITNAMTTQKRATSWTAYLVLAGEPLPGGLTARPDSLPDSRPRHLVLPQ